MVRRDFVARLLGLLAASAPRGAAAESLRQVTLRVEGMT
jgi:hypothetical protein